MDLARILSRMPINGVTATGGTSDKAGQIIKLDASGNLDASLTTGLSVFDVDVNGDLMPSERPLPGGPWTLDANGDLTPSLI